MQAEKQQAWRLCVDAKAKNFVFKLKATIPFSPNFKIFPFSILLKLSPSDLIKVKSQPHVYFPKKQTSFKSKFLRVLDKLRIRSSKNKAIAPKSSNFERAKRWFLCEGQICVSSMVFGSLALILYQLERDQKGIMMHSWVLLLLLYLLASPLKKLIVRKTCNSKVLVIINVTLMVGCSILNNCLSFHKAGYASRYIWKACNYFTSSGCLYALSQVKPKHIGGAFKTYWRRRPHKQHIRLSWHIWSFTFCICLFMVTFLYFSSIFMAP